LMVRACVRAVEYEVVVLVERIRACTAAAEMTRCPPIDPQHRSWSLVAFHSPQNQNDGRQR